MIQLSNDCRCSEPKIHPRNWDTAGADVNKKWYVQFRFYDPAFAEEYPKGKFIVRKANVNSFRTLKEKRAAAKLLLDEMIRLLCVEHYNPITDSYPIQEEIDYLIHPQTGFIRALWEVFDTLRKTHSTMRDIRSVIRGVEKAAKQIRVAEIPVSEIKRRHIKMLFAQCAKTNKRWSAHRHNQYRTYLMILFNELIELEATEIDPVSKIRKQKITKKIRPTLSREERRQIYSYLHDEYYTFWRFMVIFFHSGCRVIELLRLKGSDVDIGKQRIKVLVKKGRHYSEQWRTIKDSALPLWEEVMKNCPENAYVFSVSLQPGVRDKPICREQITRRWRMHVKEKLGVKADFYSLKHSNLDEVSEILSAREAARLAGHSSEGVTRRFYLVNEERRAHDMLKSVGNSFY